MGWTKFLPDPFEPARTSLRTGSPFQGMPAKVLEAYIHPRKKSVSVSF
jgi:hypothetical protein